MTNLPSNNLKMTLNHDKKIILPLNPSSMVFLAMEKFYRQLFHWILFNGMHYIAS
jgi:hypothetical protein